MKTLKQIQSDPRVDMVERNPDWSAEEAEDYPDWHSPKYLLWLKDGWIFDDYSHVTGADSVEELNKLLSEIEEE